MRAFLAFWYDFIVGDDWVVAVGVVLLLLVAHALAHADFQTSAWVLVPLGVALILGVSLRRAVSR
jgi:hypothetical protein